MSDIGQEKTFPRGEFNMPRFRHKDDPRGEINLSKQTYILRQDYCKMSF